MQTYHVVPSIVNSMPHGVSLGKTPRLKTSIATLLLAGIAFFSPPLFFIERYSLTAWNKPMIVVLIGMLVLVLVRRLTIPPTAIQLGFVIVSQAALLLILPFLHQQFGYAFDGGYFSLTFQILASLLVFLIFAIAGETKVIANFWVNLNLIIGACGLLVFISGIAFNLEPLDTFSSRPYYDFGLAYTNVFYQIGDLKLIRVAGFYDEPGTFAFNITFALMIARIYAMSIWKERLLILFGLTSLSMALVVIAALWLLMTLDRRHFVHVAFIVIGLIAVFSQASVEVRNGLAAVTTDRFAIADSSNRLLKGDNRSAIMKQNYRAFLDAPYIGHGVHYEQFVGGTYRSSFIGNPIAPFATNGILGSIVYNAHVLVLLVVLTMTRALSIRNKALVTLACVAILIQKPVTINGLGYLLFIVMTYPLLGTKRMPLPFKSSK